MSRSNRGGRLKILKIDENSSKKPSKSKTSKKEKDDHPNNNDNDNDNDKNSHSSSSSSSGSSSSSSSGSESDGDPIAVDKGDATTMVECCFCSAKMHKPKNGQLNTQTHNSSFSSIHSFLH
jgi:hypothetical protein